MAENTHTVYTCKILTTAGNIFASEELGVEIDTKGFKSEEQKNREKRNCRGSGYRMCDGTTKNRLRYEEVFTDAT